MAVFGYVGGLGFTTNVSSLSSNAVRVRPCGRHLKIKPQNLKLLN